MLIGLRLVLFWGELAIVVRIEFTYMHFDVCLLFGYLRNMPSITSVAMLAQVIWFDFFVGIT